MFKLEQKETNVAVLLNQEFFFDILNSEIVASNKVKNSDFEIEFLDDTCKITSDGFAVATFNFDKIVQDDSGFVVNLAQGDVYIDSKNSTLVKNLLIIGLNHENTVIFKVNGFKNLSTSGLFKTQSFSTSNTTSYINNPPSFSLTFYKDQNYTLPLYTYKDKQIVNLSTSILYVQAICNLPLNQNLSNSKVNLSAIFPSGLQTSFILNPVMSNVNYTGFGATGVVDLTNYYLQTQNNGNVMFLVSVKPFVYQNKLTTKSLVYGGSTYVSLPNVSVSGLSSTKYFTQASAFFSTANIYNQGLTTVGYSTVAATNFYTFSTSILPSGQLIPGMSTYKYVSYVYSNATNSYNGFVGMNCNFGLGVNSNNYPLIESVFIVSEDLTSTINLNTYNINYNLYYVDGSVQQIKLSNNNIKIINDGSQNYIFSNFNWKKFVNTSIGLSSIQFQFTKLATIYPSEVRLYESGLYNYTTSNFNVLNFLTFSEKTKNINFDLDVNVGETVYGFDTLSQELIETKVISIKDSITEPLYEIYFEDSTLMLPESIKILSEAGFMNLWNIRVGDLIFVYPYYKPIKKINITSGPAIKTLETTCGNYFIENVLAQTTG
jgi:hypothetical protein